MSSLLLIFISYLYSSAKDSKHFLHCKKRLAIFSSPTGISLTKLSLTMQE
jgi:hypothetical protein